MKPQVVVVGAGNAGLCAAMAARDAGAEVTVLEAAPLDERGGNSAFTGGLMRAVFNGVEDIQQLMPDLSDDEVAHADFGSYTEADFFQTMGEVTGYRCDPDLTEILVTNSFETLLWMSHKGVRFSPPYGRQAFKIGNKFTFWGGVGIEVHGGGPGLVESLFAAAEREGVNVLYQHRAESLLEEDGTVVGVVARHQGRRLDIRADAVVLASGGFEANAEWRTRYLGPGWDVAPVRGTRFNVGDGLRMALDLGAMPWGQWSGCHAVAWDRNAPPFGKLAVGDGYQKHSYPFGIVVNAKGERFLDEGADFRNYTYAKYGREILKQPGEVAWQVFDGRVSSLLRDEYRIREVSKISAHSIEELASRMEGIDEAAFIATVEGFNRSVEESIPFDPNHKDGRHTSNLAINKSNWANPLDTPPFEAYAVTCGITFTFGGLRITDRAEVLHVDGTSIPGLFACGELVGGLFFSNYPGGTGLTSGSVFGRIAGTSAGGASPSANGHRAATAQTLAS